MNKCLEVITEDDFSKRNAGSVRVTPDRKESVDKHNKLPPLKGDSKATPKAEPKATPKRKSPEPEEVKQLRKIFEQCDKSGDGRIRKWELMSACRKNYEIAQFLRLPDRYSQDREDSPSPTHGKSKAAVGRSQEFSSHFEKFFDDCQGEGTGDATEDNELDFNEFKSFFMMVVEQDEIDNAPVVATPASTPTPEPVLGPVAGKRHWHLRNLCSRGMGNSAPVTLENVPGCAVPNPVLEDLNSWYGRVGRSCVTPPPLNEFSRTIDKRLEDMILDKQRRE
jgi:hypothetical protein